MNFLVVASFILYLISDGIVSSYNLNRNLRAKYEWSRIDFQWFDENQKADFIESRRYIQENIALNKMKIWNEEIFLTIPRWRPGVPATLVKINRISESAGNHVPQLVPYPSWAMQDIGYCFGFQNVENIEIDSEDRMWILDNGRVEQEDSNYCKPKLAIIDLRTNVIVREAIFEENFLSNSSILSDLVIDSANGSHTGYIIDTNSESPQFLVYDYHRGVIEKYPCEKLRPDPHASNLLIDNTPVNLPINTGTITVSIHDRLLYFSPVSSYHVYSIPLNLFTKPRDVSKSVKDLGRKLGQTADYVMDDKGNLFYGLLNRNVIVKWNQVKYPNFQIGKRIYYQHQLFLQYVNSLSIDYKGYLYILSTHLHKFMKNEMNLEQINFRIIKVYIGSRPYYFNSSLLRSRNCSTSLGKTPLWLSVISAIIFWTTQRLQT
ncbi:major royal jelly protein 1 [Bemisia tabaci]|uniref:major royal jelly protein 1 n=1 Tax=Bemisia tabaci TaxID=7038 RepID=UPI0008F9DBC9|nr:PREDICTED: major royal jelly protein 1-like [Bemisia tabaci]